VQEETVRVRDRKRIQLRTQQHVLLSPSGSRSTAHRTW
jgi:hypothetical protein